MGSNITTEIQAVPHVRMLVAYIESQESSCRSNSPPFTFLALSRHPRALFILCHCGGCMNLMAWFSTWLANPNRCKGCLACE